MTLDQLSTYYVPEGEKRHITFLGVQFEGEETPLIFVDGSALYALCTVREAESDGPLILKQFGALQLLQAGLTPAALDPGQEVGVKRWEEGGYEIELDPGVDDAAEAM